MCKTHLGGAAFDAQRALEPPSPIPWYVAVRPDGKAWNRPFTSQAAAWRAMVKGANNDREWRQRKADLERAGWKVRAG